MRDMTRKGESKNVKKDCGANRLIPVSGRDSAYDVKEWGMIVLCLECHRFSRLLIFYLG